MAFEENFFENQDENLGFSENQLELNQPKTKMDKWEKKCNVVTPWQLCIVAQGPENFNFKCSAIWRRPCARRRQHPRSTSWCGDNSSRTAGTFLCKFAPSFPAPQDPTQQHRHSYAFFSMTFLASSAFAFDLNSATTSSNNSTSLYDQIRNKPACFEAIDPHVTRVIELNLRTLQH